MTLFLIINLLLHDYSFIINSNLNFYFFNNSLLIEILENFTLINYMNRIYFYDDIINLNFNYIIIFYLKLSLFIHFKFLKKIKSIRIHNYHLFQNLLIIHFRIHQYPFKII